MAQGRSMAPSRKPRRTISLIRPPACDAAGILRIRIAFKSWFYAFKEIRCDIGGRGFAVHRLGLGTLYHVRIGKPEECSCECLGFLSRTYCRHIMGLLALSARGLL